MLEVEKVTYEKKELEIQTERILQDSEKEKIDGTHPLGTCHPTTDCCPDTGWK